MAERGEGVLTRSASVILNSYSSSSVLISGSNLSMAASMIRVLLLTLKELVLRDTLPSTHDILEVGVVKFLF